METGIVIAIVAMLKGVLLSVLAWMRAQLKSMAGRIVVLEKAVAECQEHRIHEQREIGRLEAEIAALHSRVEGCEHA